MHRNAGNLAETKRRERIWDRIEDAAIQALRQASLQAEHQEVKHRRWIGPSLHSIRVVFKDQGANRVILVGIRGSNHISPWLPVDEANQTHGGYPDLSDKAPMAFREALDTALESLLDSYLKKRSR